MFTYSHCGTNGVTRFTVPGIKAGDRIEVADMFDLADDSGGLSTTATGTAGA
jgi:hypothetical protein